MSHFETVSVKLEANESNLENIKQMFLEIIQERPNEDLKFVDRKILNNNNSDTLQYSYFHYGVETSITPIGIRISSDNYIELQYDRLLNHINYSDEQINYIRSMIDDIVTRVSVIRNQESLRQVTQSINRIKDSGSNVRVSIIQH